MYPHQKVLEQHLVSDNLALYRGFGSSQEQCGGLEAELFTSQFSLKYRDKHTHLLPFPMVQRLKIPTPGACGSQLWASLLAGLEHIKTRPAAGTCYSRLCRHTAEDCSLT